MSRVFVESFFPAVTVILKAQTRELYEFIFPQDVAQLCSEVVLELMMPADGYSISSSIRIRNPVLLFWAAVGAAIGLHGGFVLWRRKNRQQQQQRNNMWAAAFATFGLMNVAAIPLHCLLAVVPPALLPQQHPILWLLDAYSTGSFSAAIVVACRGERSDRFFGRRSDSGSMMREWLIWNATGGIGCIFCFCIWNSTLPFELWYLAPTVTAAAVLLPLLIQDMVVVVDAKRPSWKPLAACVTAAALSVGGLLLDAPLCRSGNASSVVLLDSGRVPAVAFAACDLAFVGLLIRLLQKQDDDKKKK